MTKKNTSKTTKKEKDSSKKEYKHYIWYAIIIILIILGGTYFIFAQKGTELVGENAISLNPNVSDVMMSDGQVIAYKYNNHEFVKNDGVWYTQVEMESGPYIIAFKNGPAELEDIKINYEENRFPILTEPLSKVYVSFDHDTDQASYIATSSINLISNMKTVWYLNVSRACLFESDSCAKAPVVTCETNKDNAVIEYLESNQTSISYSDNCLRIEASKDDFIRATDKIILDWYNIV